MEYNPNGATIALCDTTDECFDNTNNVHGIHYNDDGLLNLVQADRVMDASNDDIPGMEHRCKIY